MKPGEFVGKTIMLSGVVLAIIGLALIPIVSPLIGGLIFLVGLSDIVVGMFFRSGRMGAKQTPAEAEAEASITSADTEAKEEANSAAYGTTADGSPITGDTNPYARED